MRVKKGQTSMEFFLLFGLSMAIMAMLFGTISQKQSNVFERHNADMGREVASNVGFQTEMALVQGKGYSRTFFVPETIAGDNYTVNIDNRIVYVGWNDNFVTEQTLYSGRPIQFNTNRSNVFRVLHNESGVFIEDG